MLSDNVTLADFDSALHAIYSATDPETFPDQVMPLLLRLMRSRCIGLCANALLPGDPQIAIAFSGRPDRIKWQQYPRSSYFDHPSFRYASTPAPRFAIRLSDHWPTREALEASTYFQEILRPLGLSYEVTLLLDTPRGQRLGLSVARVDRDYSDAEVQLLERLGPHLGRAFHHAQMFAQSRGSNDRASAWQEVVLTTREAEVLRWAATGRTNTEIGKLLGVGRSTVKTHLEHIFQKLGVTNRAAAVAALRDLPAPDRSWGPLEDFQKTPSPPNGG
jgi:DNA-binding CsgD family transcriptional regulator